MTASSSCHDYFKKMLELQEKLRKSEEERLELVKRFELIQRESQLRHETSINKLRMRYIEFLEEQRVREQRNYELLKALDRVDESLVLMSAKADRLHTFRQEYDAVMKRASINQCQTGSVAIDSGIISQNEERRSTKEPHTSSHYMPVSRSDIERMLYTSPPSRSSPQNFDHITNNPTKFFDRVSSSLHIPKPLDNHNDLFSQYRQSELEDYRRNNESHLSPCELENKTWTGRYISDDFDRVSKSNTRENMVTEGLLSPQHQKYRISVPCKPKSASVLGNLMNSKEEHVGCVIENELDRYIHKIRTLHDNSDSHSLEEVEQNTSGDLLNVTLSDDSLHHLPVEEKIRKPEIVTGVSKILSIADDLVSKIIAEGDNINHVVPHQITDEKTHAINHDQSSLSESELNDCVAVMNLNAGNSNTQPVTLTPVSALVIENASNNRVAIHTIKSPPSAVNIEAITIPASMDDSPHAESTKLQRESQDNRISAENVEHQGETINSIELRDHPQVVTNESHETVTGMVICNTDDLVSGEMTMSTNDTVHSIDASHHKSDAPSHNAGKRISVEMKQDETGTGNAVDSVSTVSIPNTNIVQNDENDMNGDPTVIADYDVPEPDDGNPQKPQFEQLYTQNVQDYPQNPNEMYEYNGEQYHHDPNQQYQYDLNLQYQQGTNEEYQYDQQNLQYIADPNAQYQDQPYINDGNQQYAIDPNEQYQGYTSDPQNQYGPEAYIQNSDVPYDPNTHYTYPTDDQSYVQENGYDPSQGFVPDQHLQEYQEESEHYDTHQDTEGKTNHQIEDSSNITNNSVGFEEQHDLDLVQPNVPLVDHHTVKKTMDAVESIQDSETDSTIEKNISNTESDFDFN